jgi:hypothetical protein
MSKVENRIERKKSEKATTGHACGVVKLAFTPRNAGPVEP